jgi:hypothetical protein
MRTPQKQQKPLAFDRPNMSDSGHFEEPHDAGKIAVEFDLPYSHESSAGDGVVKEKKEKKDKHGSGESGHKKHKKDRGGDIESEVKKEKKERVDYRAMLCESCRAALKLEDDEQMEDLDAASKTQPALHHAVTLKHINCLQAMLKIGNQMEGVNEAFKGKTPLHVAILNCDVDCCKCLIDAGADGSCAWQGMPALHLAISMRCSRTSRAAALAIINHMLASTAFDPNLRDTACSSPLCSAAAASDVQVAEALIKAGADASYRDAHGCTALHLALVTGCAATIALLIPFMNPLQQNSDGSTCDHLIAALPPSFGVRTSSPPSALVDAANMTPADIAANALRLPSTCEGPNFLFYDAAVTRRHVADVAFCTEAATRIDVLAGDSGVLLDAADRGSATIISAMPPASLPDLARCHSWSYLARIRELAQSCNASVPYVSIDADTMVSAGSWDAACRSAGGACAAVDAVLGCKGAYYDGTPKDNLCDISRDHADSRGYPAKGRAFVVARPPGHHCGYCLTFAV